VYRGISAFTRVPVDFDRARAAIEDDLPRLLAAALDGTMHVDVKVGPACSIAGTVVRDVCWTPLDDEQALSHFEGALKLRPIGGSCDLELAGQYRVPDSLAAVFGGGLAGHRAARQHLGVLVTAIAGQLATN
jgi:hypothetical protein